MRDVDVLSLETQCVPAGGIINMCVFKAAILNMSMLTMKNITTSMRKRSLMVTNPQRVQTQRFQCVSAHCFGFHNFTLLVQITALVSVRSAGSCCQQSKH